MSRFVEIRSYNLKPGSRDGLHRSAEWRQGPREPILALIESFTSVVLEMDDATVRGLRR
jgi:hypothetical protein